MLGAGRYLYVWLCVGSLASKCVCALGMLLLQLLGVLLFLPPIHLQDFPNPSQAQSFHQQVHLVQTHAYMSISWALERNKSPAKFVDQMDL